MILTPLQNNKNILLIKYFRNLIPSYIKIIEKKKENHSKLKFETTNRKFNRNKNNKIIIKNGQHQESN